MSATTPLPERLPDLLARHAATAHERLPRDVHDYIAGGGGEELSVREARDAWRAWRLRPHVLRDVSTVDTATDVLDAHLTLPVIVGPTAFHAVAHAGAEVETARGVTAGGGCMVVATRANTLLEDVARELRSPWWFQVYVLRDRRITEQIVRRAAAAGASALVLTGDVPIISRRRGGAAFPPLTREQYLGNMAQHIASDTRIPVATAQDPSITLETIAWLRDIASLPVLVKGVLRADDARACVDAGAAGVIVSNHGGRQLDRAVSSAAALPEVVDAVAQRSVVLVDGGIGSGVDVLIALALGAHAVLLGRPVMWALAAGGSAEVARLLDAFREDLREAMALAGVRAVAGVTRDLVCGA